MDQKKIGVAQYTDESFEQEMDMVSASTDKKVGGFFKRHWRKMAFGVGLFVVGAVAGKSLGQKRAVYADSIELEFDEETKE